MFAARNLSVLSYANGFTLWHYTSTDNNGHITSEDYFNSASDMLRKGDLIIANTDMGGSPDHKQYFVQNVYAGVVTISTAV